MGVLFAPGSWCPGCTLDQGRHPLVCAKSRAQTRDPSPPSLSANLRRSGITKRQQGFTHVHPSGLSLACGSPLGVGRSWASPSLLHTPPLPATHGEVGTGIGHLPESSLSFCSTHAKRPRVATLFSVSCGDPSAATAQARRVLYSPGHPPSTRRRPWGAACRAPPTGPPIISPTFSSATPALTANASCRWSARCGLSGRCSDACGLC